MKSPLTKYHHLKIHQKKSYLVKGQGSHFPLKTKPNLSSFLLGERSSVNKNSGMGIITTN